MSPSKKVMRFFQYIGLGSIPLFAALLFHPSTNNPSASTQAANQTAEGTHGSAQDQLIYHNNIGIALMEQFNFREAIAEFEKCLKINNRFVPALVNTGFAHFYLQEFPKAQEFLLSALSVEPNQPNALFGMGMIYRNQNQMDLALESFNKIRAVDGQDPLILYQMGQIYLKKQDYDQAETALRKVVEVSPYDTAAYYNLATTLIRKGNQAEGQKVMEAFTRLREKGGTSSTGTQYGEQGKYMLAIGEYQEIKNLGSPVLSGGTRPIQFVDVTKAAGISFQHGASATEAGLKQSISKLGSGAAFCDYDNDGYLDLYLANSSSDPGRSRGALYHNDGKGHFEDVTEKSGIRASSLGMGAYWGDFNNDGKPDLFLTNYGSNFLYQNNGDGTFKDTTAKAGVGGGDHWHLSAAIADYDHDGDLDIFVGNYLEMKDASETSPRLDSFSSASQLGGGCHLFRNNGDGTFTDVAEEAKVRIPQEAISSVAFTDFDNRRDIDFWTAGPFTGNHLYSNQRVGTFKDLNAELASIANIKALSVSVADYNKDGWMDFALTQQVGDPVLLVKNLGNGKFETENPLSLLPAQGPKKSWMSEFLDYDNDGDLDLFLVRGDQSDAGPELWENQGDGKFVDVTGRVGLNQFRGKAYRSATFGDFDNDGDTDVLLTVNGGAPVLLRNDGGNQNNWIKVRLQGTNSNKSGIGTKVEVKSGTLWQKVEINGGSGYLSQSPPEVIFGLGNRRSVDVVRLLWPGGVLQSEINLPINQTRLIHELDRKGTSCPLLYTWNGSRYQFVTDFLGGCAIGYLEEPGRYNTPDTDEYVKISGTQLQPKDGKYSLKINNQLEEVLYIDQTELLALDHPADLEVFPNERLMPDPPYPPFKIYAAKNAVPPKAAWDSHGNNVLPLLTKVDRTYPDDFKLLPYKGYAEEHDLVLDLGDLSQAKNVNLLMTAWIDYADSTANFKAAQKSAASAECPKLVPPYLQVKNPAGRWETVIPSMGFPAGLPKTMLVDLTGKFLAHDYRVRIVTSMRIYWDQILVNTFSDSPQIRQNRLLPQKAELSFAGFPREFSSDRRKPFLYDYDWIDPLAPWKSHTGDYTRFGEVTELLKSKEDMYVIMRNGDEIQIDFAASSLPPLPAGWERSFFFYADGFGKDMDIHSGAPDTVTPLPFHGMHRYPYDHTERYPDDESHRRYRREYNTRRIPAELSQLRP